MKLTLNCSPLFVKEIKPLTDRLSIYVTKFNYDNNNEYVSEDDYRFDNDDLDYKLIIRTNDNKATVILASILGNEIENETIIGHLELKDNKWILCKEN